MGHEFVFEKEGTLPFLSVGYFPSLFSSLNNAKCRIQEVTLNAVSFFKR